MVWFAWMAGNVKFVTAPTEEPFTSTSSTWKPVFGVIVNDGVAPSATWIVPLGAMPPFAPALAVAVQPVIAKLVWLESEPTLPALSNARTRTRAVVVRFKGTVQFNEPEFAMPVAIAVGNVAPPSVDSAGSPAEPSRLSVAVHVIGWMLEAAQLSPPAGDVRLTTGGGVSAAPLIVRDRKSGVEGKRGD